MLDKVNGIRSMAYLRKIFNATEQRYDDAGIGYTDADARALNLIRGAWGKMSWAWPLSTGIGFDISTL